MGQPMRIMGKGDNEAIQAQVTDDSLQITDPKLKKAGYSISDMDLADATAQYFGFLNSAGKYYIMQRTLSTNAWRYTAGDSGYAVAWSNRTTESYDYYNNVF